MTHEMNSVKKENQIIDPLDCFSKTLRIFTREREKPIIHSFLDQFNIPFEIFTTNDTIPERPFEFGVSYCYTRKIKPPMLYLSRKGFVNYHPAPLPEYPYHITDRLNPLEIAVEKKIMRWGCTVHYMNEELDKGLIIKKLLFDLMEPAKSKDELGALTHFHMMKMFKETVLNLYHFSNPVNEKYISDFIAELVKDHPIEFDGVILDEAV